LEDVVQSVELPSQELVFCGVVFCEVGVTPSLELVFCGVVVQDEVVLITSGIVVQDDVVLFNTGTLLHVAVVATQQVSELLVTQFSFSFTSKIQSLSLSRGRITSPNLNFRYSLPASIILTPAFLIVLSLLSL